MTKYLITILLFSSCAASGQTQSQYDKILLGKITVLQSDVTTLKKQMQALQDSFVSVIKRMVIAEKQLSAADDTVKVIGPNLQLDSVSVHLKYLYWKP